MRIALLSDGYPPWERGGAQKIAAQLAAGYRERGHEVVVVTAVTERSAAGRATANGVDVRKLWTPKPRAVLPYLTVHNPFAVGPVGRALDGFDPHVVHAHNAHYLSNAALRSAARRAPVVKTFHDAGTVSYGELTRHVAGGEPVSADEYRVSPRKQLRREGLRYNPIRNRHNRQTLRRYIESGVAVSDALRTALRANDVPCHETIHNGVDAAAIASAGDPSAFRSSYGLGDAPVVLFGGRTSYEKGGAHLARAFREVSVPGAKLLVTGDDEYVSRMRTLAGEAGDRIVTTGWLDREDLRAALRTATVVATPAVHLDPFPTLNLEAFAAGTPVVTSRFGGADELVADGEDGYVVDPFEVSHLADALERFLGDPDGAAAFGERGREKVRREFTVEAQVDAYLRVLRAVGTP